MIERARHRRIFIALVLCCSTRPTAAQSYQPGIDVLDYDIRLELPDTGAFIRGDVTVTARRSPAVRTMRLDLVDGLTVRRVDVGNRAVQVTRAHGTLTVPLDDALDTVSVRVRYDGQVRDGLIVRKDALGRWTWFGDNWPDRAREWLPTVDHPSDKATVTWTVRAPNGRTVIANGTAQGTRQLTGADSGFTETRWRESQPVPTYVMVIAAGPLIRFDLANDGCKVSSVVSCVPQSVYALPETQAWLPGPFAAAVPIVALFERLIGRFPYEKLAHIQSETRFGGMENASAIFYAGNLFSTRRLTDGLIAHETAHQWFGDAVTEREWGHLWLSEGFATYFAALWTREARGDSAFRQEMAGIRRHVMDDTVVARRPVLDTAQTNYLQLLNTNSYQKGGYVLFMLNRMLGDSAFFNGLRSYYAHLRNGNAASDDLREELERSSGRPLRTFFDQWLRRPGVARPAISWTYEPGTRTVTVHVLQERTEPYELPLTIEVRAGRATRQRMEIVVPAEREATIRLPQEFGARPSSIVFDPDEVLLARIDRP